MKANQFLSLSILLALTTVSHHAFAEVYKCTSSIKSSTHKSVVYTDIPCKQSAGHVQTVTQAKLKLANSYSSTSSEASNIDLLVSRAVLNREFALAKSLAKTKEHWRLISLAEGRHTVSSKPVAAPIVIVKDTSRNDCVVARRDFESTSRTRWRQKRLVAAKKSAMFAACGVAEPVQQYRPIVVGQTYGGVHSSRWVAPGYGRKVYHRPYAQHHKKHRFQHVRNKSGLFINYKSKHFGLRAQSSGIQQHTDIRQQFRSNSIGTQKHADIRQQFRQSPFFK